MKLNDILNEENKSEILLPTKKGEKYGDAEDYYDEDLIKYKKTNIVISTKSNGVHLMKKQQHLEYKFGKINGTFLISDCGLESLEGSPTHVTEGFFCQSNKLKTLKGAPEIVAGEFCCDSNQLTDLQGSPKEVEKYSCNGTGITSLKGAPIRVEEDFSCVSNQISSFEFCPRYIGDDLNLENNKITSLKGVHKHFDHCEKISLSMNTIVEGGIGLLLIPGLKEIWFRNDKTKFAKAIKIIDKYVGQGKAGLLACQEELIEKGLEAFAVL